MTIIYHNGKIYTLKQDDTVLICNDYIEILTADTKKICKQIGEPINPKVKFPKLFK